MEGKQPLVLQVSTLIPQLHHHHHSSSSIITSPSSLSNNTKQTVNRLEVLPNQQHRLTPSTLVVKKVNTKLKGGLNLPKKSTPLTETSFVLSSDDPRKQSIPSYFPSTLRPRQGSAPSKTRNADTESTISGSYTSRKTTKSTPRQLGDDFLDEEMQKKAKNTEHSGIFEKQLECLLMDGDIYAARQSIKDAYLFKSYERDTSKFSRKIELSQLGVTLILDRKENFYNFYSKFKGSNNSLLSEETISEANDIKTSDVEETSPTTTQENETEANYSNHLSIEPFITEDEKQQIVNVLESTGESYLTELFKTKYKRDIKSIYNLSDPQLSKQKDQKKR